MRTLFATVALSFAFACSGAPKPEPKSKEAAAPLVFIEDDYARALAEARSAGRPIFVDAWAPWCHTCISMRAFVFPDPQIRRRASEFVWLAIDTEKAQNASFLAAHPMESWPTLWVIDPRSEVAAVKWNGSLTASELASLLDDAKLAVSHGDAGGEAAAAYLQGNQETGAGKTEAAILSYRRALAAAPESWPKRARVVEALSARLRAKKDYDGCLALAANELPRMAPSTSVKAVAMDAVLCLMAMPEEKRRANQGAVIEAAERVARDPAQPILADDRSELFGETVDALTELGRAEDAKSLAREWAALLDREAAGATTPDARAVFDPHRLEAYRALGEPERAVPMLAQSERDFPSDYNPPARLAVAYLSMKRYEDALAAIDRALARAYGPRKLRLYTIKADVFAATGDKAKERATVDEALAGAQGLVLMGSAARTKAALEARAQKLK